MSRPFGHPENNLGVELERIAANIEFTKLFMGTEVSVSSYFPVEEALVRPVEQFREVTDGGAK